MKQKVLGIGGVFFRAKDIEALTAWYDKHLGINIQGAPMQQAGGLSVVCAMGSESDYFGRPEQGWMVNFTVENLDTLKVELESAGVSVETRPEWDGEYGKFARIVDPEGNPLELWQPPE